MYSNSVVNTGFNSTSNCLYMSHDVCTNVQGAPDSRQSCLPKIIKASCCCRSDLDNRHIEGLFVKSYMLVMLL